MAIDAATTAPTIFVFLASTSITTTNQVDIGDGATGVSFGPFMILSYTGLRKTIISDLSTSRTVSSALHTRLTAVYAKMCLILVCAPHVQNGGFCGLDGGVGVHMVACKAHSYRQQHRNGL